LRLVGDFDRAGVVTGRVRTARHVQLRGGSRLFGLALPVLQLLLLLIAESPLRELLDLVAVLVDALELLRRDLHRTPAEDGDDVGLALAAEHQTAGAVTGLLHAGELDDGHASPPQTKTWIVLNTYSSRAPCHSHGLSVRAVVAWTPSCTS